MLSKLYRLFTVILLALVLGVSIAALSIIAIAPGEGRVRAAPLAQDTYTPIVTITQPATGEVITTTHLPTYTVLIDVAPACDGGSGCLPPTGSLQIQIISITIKSLGTGQIIVNDSIATAAPISQAKTLTYPWTLPISDNKQFVLVATAVNSQPTAGVSKPVTVTVNTVEASALTYTLIVATAGTGEGRVTPPGGVYTAGEVVTLTAIVSPTSDFAGWSGAATGTNLTATVIMTENKAVTATFNLREYDLIVTRVGSGTVSKNPDQSVYHYGDVVTLSAEAANEWWFGEWSGDWSGDFPGGSAQLLLPTLVLTMTENRAVTATFRTTSTLFLPAVLKNYSPPKPLINGDFQLGNLSGWDTRQGPFQGHGSGLPQTAILSGTTDYVAQLGDPAYQNNAIPNGYGYIAQTFTVQKRYLQIRYHVSTYDVVKGQTTGQYFDTFEISLNKPPDQITDNDRNVNGCTSTILNPSGTLGLNSNLVLCGGYNGSFDPNTLHNLGWKTVYLDMQSYMNQNVTLYFAVWNREYSSSSYNDKGYYNTWVELDDIKFIN